MQNNWNNWNNYKIIRIIYTKQNSCNNWSNWNNILIRSTRTLESPSQDRRRVASWSHLRHVLLSPNIVEPVTKYNILQFRTSQKHSELSESEKEILAQLELDTSYFQFICSVVFTAAGNMNTHNEFQSKTKLCSSRAATVRTGPARPNRNFRHEPEPNHVSASPAEAPGTRPNGSRAAQAKTRDPVQQGRVRPSRHAHCVRRPGCQCGRAQFELSTRGPSGLHESLRSGCIWHQDQSRSAVPDSVPSGT